MDSMLRKALRKHRELRNQFENCLLGEEGEAWEIEAKKFLAKRPCWSNTPFRSLIEEAPLPFPDSLKRLLDYQIKFWEKGVSLSVADLSLPAYQQGFDWPIIRPPGITAQAAYNLATQFFPCWKHWDDLEILQVAEPYLRPVDEAVVVLIQPSVETDTRLSYNNAVARGYHFLGLTHRIFLESFGFWLNRDHPTVADELKIPPHLDLEGWTRTSSLDFGGFVANAYWSPAFDRFKVFWSFRGDARPIGGVRLAVL